MRPLAKIACAIVLLASVGNSHAQYYAQYHNPISADIHFGTLGAGVEIKRKFNDHINGRLVINQYEFSYDETEDGTEYTGELDWSTYGVIADWHPAGNGFRLSLGLLANGNELRSSSVGGSFSYGTNEFGNDKYYEGNANIKVAFESLAPYASIGWSSQKPRGLSVNFELGAMFQGTPLLSANGSVTDSNAKTCGFSIDDKGNATVADGCSDGFATNLKDDLETGHDEETSDFDDFDVYPVIVFGLQYRF